MDDTSRTGFAALAGEIGAVRALLRGTTAMSKQQKRQYIDAPLSKAALKRLNEGYVFPRAGYLEPEPVPLDLVRPSVLALFREQEPFLQASVLVGSVSLR